MEKNAHNHAARTFSDHGRVLSHFEAKLQPFRSDDFIELAVQFVRFNFQVEYCACLDSDPHCANVEARVHDWTSFFLVLFAHVCIYIRYICMYVYEHKLFPPLRVRPVQIVHMFMWTLRDLFAKPCTNTHTLWAKCRRLIECLCVLLVHCCVQSLNFKFHIIHMCVSVTCLWWSQFVLIYAISDAARKFSLTNIYIGKWLMSAMNCHNYYIVYLATTYNIYVNIYER